MGLGWGSALKPTNHLSREEKSGFLKPSKWLELVFRVFVFLREGVGVLLCYPRWLELLGAIDPPISAQE